MKPSKEIHSDASISTVSQSNYKIHNHSHCAYDLTLPELCGDSWYHCQLVIYKAPATASLTTLEMTSYELVSSIIKHYFAPEIQANTLSIETEIVELVSTIDASIIDISFSFSEMHCDADDNLIANGTVYFYQNGCFLAEGKVYINYLNTFLARAA